jgi:outer membrane protein assembly factor BamD (BamD/ComL family)
LSANSPSDSQLLYADALFDENDFDAAILEFKRYIFYNPQSALLDYVLYRIGQSHYYSHRPSDAQKTLERLLKEYPQSPFRLHARFMLGKTFMDNEDFTRARNEFRLITESTPPLFPPVYGGIGGGYPRKRNICKHGHIYPKEIGIPLSLNFEKLLSFNLIVRSA